MNKPFTNSQINDFARAAKEDILNGLGRTENVWNIIAAYNEDINELYRRYANDFDNDIYFVERCEKKLEYALKSFDGERDFDKLAHRTLRQTVGDFYKNRSKHKKAQDSFEYITSEGDMDKTKHVSIADPTANIEENFLSDLFEGSIIDEYAKDEKRRYILTRWAEEGNGNETEIAREMVDLFGGKWDTHRQMIKRFRKQMREALA